MTRRDYELLAKAVREVQTEPPMLQIPELVNILCRDLEDDNPRFDQAKFRKACLWSEEEV